MKWELAAIVSALLGGPLSMRIPQGDVETGCWCGVFWISAFVLMVVGLAL